MNELELLRRLVGFDTTSARSNAELIAFVQNYLADLGIDSHLSRDDTGAKANLFATIGPAGEPGVVLSGHTDCVPVTGQPWRSDPFTLTEDGDDLVARGTADMKGYIACALAAVGELDIAAMRRPVHLAFTYDEEVGCIGVHRLIAAIPPEVARPKCVLVGEPTGMKVITAHKGIAAYRTTVRGKAGHSSRPDLGHNAVIDAARLVSFLESLAAELRERAQSAVGFLPPYTTLNVGMIHGGAAVNVIADQCRVEWEFRLLPGDDEEEIPRRVAAFVRDEGIDASTAELARAPAFSAESSVASGLAASLTGDSQTSAVSFATEAGIFERAGMAAVVCGPGEITDAHQPNEKISRQQLAAGMAYVRGAMRAD